MEKIERSFFFFFLSANKINLAFVAVLFSERGGLFDKVIFNRSV